MADLLTSWAIVVGAGDGLRLGEDRPKAFVGLGEQVMLAHSVRMLDDHPALDGIVLVVPEGWEEPATLLADDLVAGKVAAAVTGGSTRAASVAAGLAAVPDDADLILVHDAARPFATPELVSRVLEALGQADGAVPGVPLTDTVKRVSAGLVVETPDRSAAGGGADAPGVPRRRAAPRARAAGRGAGGGHRLRIAGGGDRRQGRRRRGRPRQPQGDHTR